MSRGCQAPSALLEEEVGAADQLMERVQVATSAFDVLQRLGSFAYRVDGWLFSGIDIKFGHAVVIPLVSSSGT